MFHSLAIHFLLIIQFFIQSSPKYRKQVYHPSKSAAFPECLRSFRVRGRISGLRQSNRPCEWSNLRGLLREYPPNPFCFPLTE